MQRVYFGTYFRNGMLSLQDKSKANAQKKLLGLYPVLCIKSFLLRCKRIVYSQEEKYYSFIPCWIRAE